MNSLALAFEFLADFALAALSSCFPCSMDNSGNGGTGGGAGSDGDPGNGGNGSGSGGDTDTDEQLLLFIDRAEAREPGELERLLEEEVVEGVDNTAELRRMVMDDEELLRLQEGWAAATLGMLVEEVDTGGHVDNNANDNDNGNNDGDDDNAGNNDDHNNGHDDDNGNDDDDDDDEDVAEDIAGDDDADDDDDDDDDDLGLTGNGLVPIGVLKAATPCNEPLRKRLRLFNITP